MKYLCKITVVMALFTALGLASAHADRFHVRGSYVETGFNNGTAEGTLSGSATPGGAFVGAFWEKVSVGGIVLDGRATLDFGGGDTLTCDYLMVYDPVIGRYQGTYTIARGTGALRHVAGGGDIAAMPNGLPAHLFWLDGDLFLD